MWLLMFHHPVQSSICLHFQNFKVNFKSRINIKNIEVTSSWKVSYNFSAPAGKIFLEYVCDSDV